MRVDAVDVSSFTIPTNKPESDGTLEWDWRSGYGLEPKRADAQGYAA